MKKVIVLAACLFTASASIKAQEISKKPVASKTEHTRGEHKEKLTPEQRAQKQVDELNSEVTLTEDQKPKIYNLALEKVKKVEEIKAKYKGQPENKETAKNEIETVRKTFRDNVKSVLTPEQLETLKAKHKEKKAAGKPNSLDQD